MTGIALFCTHYTTPTIKLERVTGLEPAFDFRLSDWKSDAQPLGHTRFETFKLESVYMQLRNRSTRANTDLTQATTKTLCVCRVSTDTCCSVAPSPNLRGSGQQNQELPEPARIQG